MRLSEEEFVQRLATTRMTVDSRTAVACKMVLVLGKSMSFAAKAAGITNGPVTRGIKRLENAVITKSCMCPRCGHEF